MLHNNCHMLLKDYNTIICCVRNLISVKLDTICIATYFSEVYFCHGFRGLCNCTTLQHTAPHCTTLHLPAPGDCDCTMLYTNMHACMCTTMHHTLTLCNKLSHKRSTCIPRLRRSVFFWFSRCPSHTWAHIKYLSSLCVCTRIYEHTQTHHPNTRKNREIYKTNPLSLPLPKHSLPHQQQALTMNKLEKPPLPIPPHPRMQVLRITCDTRACSR